MILVLKFLFLKNIDLLLIKNEYLIYKANYVYLLNAIQYFSCEKNLYKNI